MIARGYYEALDVSLYKIPARDTRDATRRVRLPSKEIITDEYRLKERKTITIGSHTLDVQARKYFGPHVYDLPMYILNGGYALSLLRAVLFTIGLTMSRVS